MHQITVAHGIWRTHKLLARIISKKIKHLWGPSPLRVEWLVLRYRTFVFVLPVAFSSLSSYLSRMTHHWPADNRVESISSASFYFQINPSRDRYPGKRVVAHKIFHAPLNQKMSTAFVWHNLTERNLDFLWTKNNSLSFFFFFKGLHPLLVIPLVVIEYSELPSLFFVYPKACTRHCKILYMVPVFFFTQLHANFNWIKNE